MIVTNPIRNGVLETDLELAGHSITQDGTPITLGGVPLSRTINGHPLSSDVTLTAADVSALTQAAADALYSAIGHTHTFTSLTGKPTTIVGYGITNAYTKTEVDSAISAAAVGLLDDRGSYNASGNAFPSSGGSGGAGAILKGDLWTISVGGTLNGIAVTAGDVVRALVDTPGQTGSNWVVTENNLGFVPVNTAGTLALGGFSAITGTLPAGNVATLNQNTTGSAASLSVSGQTGLITLTGIIGTNRIKTVRDAADTILELGGSYTPTGTWTNMVLASPSVTGSLTTTGAITSTASSTGAFSNTIQNTNSAGVAALVAASDTTTCEFGMRCSARAAYGVLLASQAYLYTASAAGIVFANDTDSGLIDFVVATSLTVRSLRITKARVAMNVPAQLKSYTVATLPAGSEGDMAYVTDATAPTYNATLTGGGSVKVPVFRNATVWVSH